MAIGRDAMTKEVSDRRKRVLKIKDLMGSPAAKGRMSPMKMPASAPVAAPDMESISSPAMKKGGTVKEKASGEKYASKSAMKKHEAGESKDTERKEDKMRGGGIAVKGKGVALRGGGIAQKGKGIALKKGGSAKKPGVMVMIAVGKGKKK